MSQPAAHDDGFRTAQWLQWRHEKTHGNADLVAHFFRRAEGLLRKGGGFGLIASNTIAQGDTRESGLRQMIAHGTVLYRAVRRLKWPGEAAVVVSVVHGVKRPSQVPPLRIDGRDVTRVSAFLVNGDNDDSPMPLAINEGRSFKGSELHGSGFMFDDYGAANGVCEPLSIMQEILEKLPSARTRIKPFVTGEDINTSPVFESRRYVIDINDLSLEQSTLDFPELVAILRDRVYPERQSDKRENRKSNWWRFGEQAKGLYAAISGRQSVLCTLFTSPHMNFSIIPANGIFANAIVVTTFEGIEPFSCLQSRAHEVWARFFSSSMKDDLRYAPTDCLLPFPFPEGYEGNASLAAAGQAYHDYRAELMVATNKGLTPTYNRFHDHYDDDPAIQRLRDLHADMDRAVLRAYGWDDLADTANPVFLTEETETEFTYQGRLFWPSDFRDEVLARLLDLNRTRHTAEANAGVAIATAPDAPHSAATDRIRARQMDFGLDPGPLFDRTSE